jgi:succinate dehydrogenase flavin-adding protein (antitoxin of CptAB toxin-antitoxin module)
MTEAGRRSPDRGRLRWRCMRRGLLELDLVLERFLATRFDALDAGQLEALDRLLDMEDHDLWAVINGRAECDRSEFAQLVALLRSC